MIRVGISSCLLGERVRWDGNHKLDPDIRDILGSRFEWVLTCPEVDLGMGVPREPVRLTGSPGSPRMLGTETGADWTERMVRYAEDRVRELSRLNLCGYVFKSRSPSCGMREVRIFSTDGRIREVGRGLFAAALMRRFPSMPVEDEDRLRDPAVRDEFIARVTCRYRRPG